MNKEEPQKTHGSVDDFIDHAIQKRAGITGRSHGEKYDSMIRAFFDMGKISIDQYERYKRREVVTKSGASKD